MSCVLMLQRGHSGDGCVLASTLCKYDLRTGDLFVQSWARVRRVRRGSISSELLMCGNNINNNNNNNNNNICLKSNIQTSSVVEVCAVFCYCLLWLDA